VGDDRAGAVGEGIVSNAPAGMTNAIAPPPVVSVIVPAYNAERFLGRALRSVLAQTYPHLELLVVDDGSADKTADVIRSFTDTRIRHLSQPNRGQGAARNLGIRASTGRYVTFLDADDVYLPQKVERQVEFLTAHPECEIAFCNALHFYSRRPRRLLVRRSRPRPDVTLRDLVRASFVNLNTMMIVGDTLRRGGLFREDRYYPEEWDLCLRLARAGHRFGHQPEGLVLVEIREDSNTTMAVQFALKRHTLEMFERLFAGMAADERAAYGADAVLRSCRRKLAWASLVSADPARSFESSAQALPWALAVALRVLLKILPVELVRAAVAAAWRLRQRLALARVTQPPAGATQSCQGNGRQDPELIVEEGRSDEDRRAPQTSQRSYRPDRVASGFIYGQGEPLLRSSSDPEREIRHAEDGANPSVDREVQDGVGAMACPRRGVIHGELAFVIDAEPKVVGCEEP
jgi:GT2 family glycosyltransferase